MSSTGVAGVLEDEGLNSGNIRMPDGTLLWWETMENGKRVYFADLGEVDGDTSPWLVYNTMLSDFHLLTALNIESSFRYTEKRLTTT